MYKKPSLSSDNRIGKNKDKTKVDAINELTEIAKKRTNLTIPVDLHQSIAVLKDCLMPENGRKIQLENLYYEALTDLIKKYLNNQGNYVIDNPVSFEKFIKAVDLKLPV